MVYEISENGIYRYDDHPVPDYNYRIHRQVMIEASEDPFRFKFSTDIPLNQWNNIFDLEKSE